MDLTLLQHIKWKVRSECDLVSSNVSSFTSWQFFTTLSSIRISSGDDELIDNLKIYPNPTRGLFNISFVSDDIVTLELSVLDAYGKSHYDRKQGNVCRRIHKTSRFINLSKRNLHGSD